jgi:DNA-binding CsgD family transcriptional regulator
MSEDEVVAMEVTTESQPSPTREDLSAKQRETLREIHEEPTATQREIGETLNVSAATISNRLSDIPGFDWQNRENFVSNLFSTPLISDGQGQVESATPTNKEPRLADLEARVRAVESATGRSELPLELAHKVLHECMNSDEFSEEEELELIQALFGESTEENS